jgi:anti-sigma factor (TIGR02949 family)
MTEDCKTVDPLVTAYVDGEIAEGDRRRVDDHLAACPPCHSRVAAERAVRDAIRARCRDFASPPAPSSLRAACEGLCARQATSRPSDTRGTRGTRGTSGTQGTLGALMPRLVPFALAASLVLIVGSAFVYQLTDSSATVMAAELTTDHLKCFAVNALLGTHEAPTAVESAMLAGFAWRMHLPENPASAGLELVGSRPCLYGEGKVAHLMYRHQGRPVSLFMLPKSSRAAELVDVLGHEAAIWCAGDRTFVLIAREPRQDVQRLASFVQASLR